MADQTQGSLADSATAGLSDGIPLGFSEGGTALGCKNKTWGERTSELKAKQNIKLTAP